MKLLQSTRKVHNSSLSLDFIHFIIIITVVYYYYYYYYYYYCCYYYYCHYYWAFFLQTVFSCTFFARKSIGDYNLISILGPLIASLPRGGLVWFISTMLLPDMELKVLSSRYKYKYLKLVLKYKYRVSGLYLL